MVLNGRNGPGNNDGKRHSEKRGMDTLVVLSLFAGAILLLIALLYLAY